LHQRLTTPNCEVPTNAKRFAGNLQVQETPSA
jgi:hypothetical protein